MLIGNDIIVPEGIVIDPLKRKAVIRSCGGVTCPLKVMPRKRVINHTVRCAKTIVVDANTSRIIPIRFTTQLDTKQDYLLRPYVNNCHLPAGCYVLRSIIAGDQDGIFLTNLSDKPITVSKDIRVGLIESLEDPQQITMWSTASEEVKVLFTPPSLPMQRTEQNKQDEERKPPILESEDTHNSKTPRSELAVVNTTSDIDRKSVV